MNDMQDYFVHEFVAEYKAGHMSRRDMLRRVMYITGGVASAASLLTLMGCGTENVAPASSPAPASVAASSASPAASSARASTAASSAPASAAASSAGPASGAASQAASASASASGAAVKSPISVAANDPAIDAKDVSFPGNGTTLLGYQALPKGATGPLPFVLVVHRNLGLEEQIKDVARRWAKEGYGAMALDLLSHEGGTASVTDKAKLPAMLSAVDPSRHVADFAAAAGYYAKQSFVKPDKMGINGFCFGGGIVWRAVEGIPTLKAAVPFYGPPPPLDAVKDIKAAVLGVYSADPNDFANANRDKLEAGLKAANVTYDMKVYPGTHHDFYNDTGAAYNQEQALAAWKDALAWFAKYLKA